MAIHLVDGDYRLHILDGEPGFRDYVTRCKHLKMSNMLELLAVFSEKRSGTVTKFKQKHMLLHEVMWVTFNDGSTLVPLVGSPKEMYDRMTMKAEHGIGFAYPTVKDLLNGSKTKIKDKDGRIWRKGCMPTSATRLRHGDYLQEASSSEVTVPRGGG